MSRLYIHVYILWIKFSWCLPSYLFFRMKRFNLHIPDELQFWHHSHILPLYSSVEPVVPDPSCPRSPSVLAGTVMEISGPCSGSAQMTHCVQWRLQLKTQSRATQKAPPQSNEISCSSLKSSRDSGSSLPSRVRRTSQAALCKSWLCKEGIYWGLLQFCRLREVHFFKTLFWNEFPRSRDNS